MKEKIAMPEKKEADVNDPGIVFTVSALLFDEKLRLLLYKDSNEGKFKQPGKTYDPEEDQCTPYEKVESVLISQLGLNRAFDYEISKIHSPEKQERLIDIFSPGGGKAAYKEEMTQALRKFLFNEIVPVPFLITKEYDYDKNGEPINKNRYRIDLYYAFQVNKGKVDDVMNKITEREKIIKVKLFNSFDMINDREKIEYKDLIYAYDTLLDQINQGKRKPTVRFCTFDNENMKDAVCWRITNSCNSDCSYCLLSDKLIETGKQPVLIGEDEQDKALRLIEAKKKSKVIFSGGEPLLITNLVPILEKLEKIETCKQFSICTNGSFPNHEIFNKIESFTKFNKFTISIDGFNKRTFNNYKKKIKFEDVLGFVGACHKKNVKFSVNVLANKDLLRFPEKYIEFWADKNIYNVSISADLNHPDDDYNDFKNRLIRHYLDIYAGTYGDISFLRKFELILTECNRGCKYLNVNFIMPDGSLMDCPENNEIGREI